MVNFCLQCGREINTNAVLCDKCSTIYMMFSVPNLDKTYSHNKEEVLQIKEESGDKEQIISNTGVYQFGLKSLRPPMIDKDNNTVIYDCIYFGEYPQFINSGKTRDPIRWRVLDIKGNKAFVIADICIDSRPFDIGYSENRWKYSSLRAWLNSFFYHLAFTYSEGEAILNTDLPDVNSSDKIFLLSYSEIYNEQYGFQSLAECDDEMRYRGMSPYAIHNMNKENTLINNINKRAWWLRTKGYDNDLVMAVLRSGKVYSYGWGAKSVGIGVCPALWINLDKTEVWKYAGDIQIHL